MADEFIAHPLITITNVIWSFSRTTRQLQILLIHRADDPYAPGERALALTYMTYLPTMPKLRPGYGATDARWFAFSATANDYQLQNGALTFQLDQQAAHLAFDHARILGVAIRRIRNKLDYQPSILQVLGHTFTLKEAREVYAPFLNTTAAAIDNSNFKKTHQHLFVEVGTAHVRTRSGRPPKLFKLA